MTPTQIQKNRRYNPVFEALRPFGFGPLSRNITHAFWPGLRWARGDQARAHYLYTPAGDIDPTAVDTDMGALYGALAADGTGGSLSYTPEVVSATMVEGFSILHTDGSDCVRPLLSLGFDRELTAGERTALSGAALIAYVAGLAGVDPADCSALTLYEYQQMCFKLKVDTTRAGSANDTFIIAKPGVGSFDYSVDWGNGDCEHNTANTDHTKDYDETGTFLVCVYGTFPQLAFNNGGDKAKVLGAQLGDVAWASFATAFRGCSNFNLLVGHANTSNVTDMRYMFNQCGSFNQPVEMLDTSNVTDMTYMFNGCVSFNQSVAHFDTSQVTNMLRMFQNCTAFKQSLAAFDMEAVTVPTQMCSGCDLNAPGTTANYDATLVAWAAQDLVNSKSVDFGTSKYGAGATARAAIIADDLWTITDGGVGP